VRYHKGIERGLIKVDTEPELVFSTPVSAVIDGQAGMGQLVGQMAMELALEKAQKSGIGLVSVRNSNHFGIAGYYAKMALDQGFLGFATTNSEAIMVPTFGRQAMLGSNPLAVAMPADPYPFLLDCSTTVVTRGKLEVYNKLEQPLPEGWALDKAGQPSTDAADVLFNIANKQGGGIMPLGGSAEVTGSHKGYGFGMLSEIFAAVLSLGTTSNLTNTGGVAGICHGFAAVSLDLFGDGQAIRQHLSTYLAQLRDSPLASGQERIYTHGEKEILAEKKRLEEGIPVHANTLREMLDFAAFVDLDIQAYLGELDPATGEARQSGLY
jgi:LDH2 family malate/lactate/ureidoglycolate dehydrogenase